MGKKQCEERLQLLADAGAGGENREMTSSTLKLLTLPTRENQSISNGNGFTQDRGGGPGVHIPQSLAELTKTSSYLSHVSQPQQKTVATKPLPSISSKTSSIGRYQNGSNFSSSPGKSASQSSVTTKSHRGSQSDISALRRK